ncbi:YdeI/OmpD-associated family protein [Lacibacter sp. MH-610]|uniref:YdeI/OmpD-associated family protein n=1 Tax=Lacibacter sp. MH-610 TaxID=3020883 RepID=UPI0038916748
MVRFKATIQKFQKQGEKTGWTYISIPQKVAEQINPGVKKSYRVKGRLDAYVFDGISLLPMGEGDFIIPLKADIRKKLGKRAGETLMAELELQQKAYEIDADFMACLEDEPAALRFFETLPKGHRNYFSKWIESAKTEPTRAKRIALAVNALAKKWGYAEMIRAQKKD